MNSRPRSWQTGNKTGRATICPGSNNKPLSHRLNVGICPFCGVRTFLRHSLIRPHETTPAEVAEHRRRGPRTAKEN